MHFTEEEKQALVKLLLLTAGSDGTFNESEKLYVLNVLAQLGLDANELDTHDDTEIRIPESEQLRMTILYYLLFLIRSDKAITSEEEELVRKIGIQLGFRQLMVDGMINVMKEYVEKDLPKEALLDAIKPYMN